MGDRNVTVYHAPDHIAQIVDVRLLRPASLLQDGLTRDFRSQSVPPSTLEITDEQARLAGTTEDEVIDPKITMHDAERVQAAQPVDELQNPALIHRERMHEGETMAGMEFLEHQLAVRRPPEQLDDVGGSRHAGARSALAQEQILDLTHVLWLLDKMLVGIDGSGFGERGERLADVFGIVVDDGEWWRLCKRPDRVADDFVVAVGIVERRDIALQAEDGAGERVGDVGDADDLVMMVLVLVFVGTFVAFVPERVVDGVVDSVDVLFEKWAASWGEEIGRVALLLVDGPQAMHLLGERVLRRSWTHVEQSGRKGG